MGEAAGGDYFKERRGASLFSLKRLVGDGRLIEGLATFTEEGGLALGWGARLALERRVQADPSKMIFCVFLVFCLVLHFCVAFISSFLRIVPFFLSSSLLRAFRGWRPCWC